MTRTWPEDWEARRAGEGCPFCEQGRPEANEYGARFLAGRVSDAYLQRSGPSSGYSIVVFRGRHAADPTELTVAELTAFWREVRTVAKTIERVFSPAHLNYQLLGNAVPHVHVHIVPRYTDDPAPGRPLPFEETRVPDEEFDEQLKALTDGRPPVSFPATHHGLTADMFVVRDGRFLVLTRAGLGEGIEYIPGGIVDPGEDPMDAAVRETREESGLEVTEVEPLRVWTYPTPDGWETVHATFVCRSASGDVALTDEHTASRWVTPDEYVERWCTPELEEAFPAYAGWFRHVRRNCEMIRTFL